MTEEAPNPADEVTASKSVNTDDDETYQFDDDMSIDEVQQFVDTMLNMMVNKDELRVDLHKAEHVTTSGVQAIISLNRYAVDNQKTIKWVKPHSGFADAFNNLGFYSEMMKLEFDNG